MCGITAILDFETGRTNFRPIGVMAAALAHRGPDDSGFLFVSEKGRVWETREPQGPLPDGFIPMLAMGFQRLAIIDLSPQAHQPMCNEDGTLWLVFNGEIYNYVELMAELKKRGHVFRSGCDSEVIVHGYEEWGAECVQRFNGMWSFALWDSRKQLLFCSRDRFGVKPFFYFWDESSFCLASEPKAILRSGLFAPSPNHRYLYRFLTDSLQQDGEDTFYIGIRSLLPGHNLEVKRGKLTQTRYWDYAPEDVADRYDLAHPSEMFRELLLDAVRMRLRSDVPLGACLSGGLDSSSVVAIATHLLGRSSLDTFSAVFGAKKNDETPYMEYMAKECETRNHHIFVGPDDLPDVMPKIVWHLDGPCLSASTYPFWKVCQLARECVTVLLDGQGADELLGGYLGFFPACLISDVRSCLSSGSLADWKSAAARLIEVVRFAGWRQLYFLYRDYSPIGTKIRPHRWFLGTEKVVHADIRASLERGDGRAKPPRKFGDELTEVLYQSHSRENLPGLLQYGDGISMAQSVEARLPFMDYRLIEFCFALPPETKIRGTTTKWLLRNSMRGVVPDRILDRRDKIGFATPFAEWIRGPLRNFLLDVLDAPLVQAHGVFDMAMLQKIVRRHLEGKIDMSFYIWRWLTTELWLGQLDGLRVRESMPMPINAGENLDSLPCELR